MKLIDAAQQIGRELLAPRVKNILVAVGFNNRSSTAHHARLGVRELKRAAGEAELKSVTVFVNQKPFQRGFMPAPEQQMIGVLNDDLNKEMVPERFIATTGTEEVRTKPDGFHLTDESASRIWQQSVRSIISRQAKN